MPSNPKPRTAPGPKRIDKIVNLGRTQLKRRLIASCGEIRASLTILVHLIRVPRISPTAINFHLVKGTKDVNSFGTGDGSGRTERLIKTKLVNDVRRGNLSTQKEVR